MLLHLLFSNVYHILYQCLLVSWPMKMFLIHILSMIILIWICNILEEKFPEMILQQILTDLQTFSGF